MSKVQISMELFMELLDYFFIDELPASKGALADSIRQQHDVKLDKLLSHYLYTLYKRTPSFEEKENFTNSIWLTDML